MKKTSSTTQAVKAPTLSKAKLQPGRPTIEISCSKFTQGGSGKFSYVATITNYKVVSMKANSKNPCFVLQVDKPIVPNTATMMIKVTDNDTNETSTSNKVVLN